MNQEQLKGALWTDLQALAQSINEAWCLLGDFNTILYKEDRKGGTDVQDHEVHYLSNRLGLRDLQEIKCIWAYYSWTNKRVWSRIDRVFTNVLWCETMDYTQTHYLPSSLSDHTPLLI